MHGFTNGWMAWRVLHTRLRRDGDWWMDGNGMHSTTPSV